MDSIVFKKKFVLALALFAAVSLFVVKNLRADDHLSAEKSWQALTNFPLPSPPPAWKTNAPTDEEFAKFREQEKTQALVAANQARDFYSRFPNDANANDARIVEANLLFLAVHLGATNRLADLDAREKELLKISALPEDARFNARLDILDRELESATGNRDVLKEKAGRELIREFPSQAEGYHMLLELAQMSDEPKKIHELAVLADNTNAPVEIRAGAENLLKNLAAIGKPVELKFTAVDGRTVDLSRMRGKVVLVDFWATWCLPCIAGVPDLKAAYDKLHSKGFEIVGVSLDEQKIQLLRFVAAQKIPWPQHFDGLGFQGELPQRFGIDGIPAQWLVDKKGNLRDINARVDLQAKVEKLLAE